MFHLSGRRLIIADVTIRLRVHWNADAAGRGLRPCLFHENHFWNPVPPLISGVPNVADERDVLYKNMACPRCGYRDKAARERARLLTV